MNYKTIRSTRRTAAIQIKNGEVIVRAPQAMTDVEISRLISDHTAWIEKHLAMEQAQKENTPDVAPLTMEEIYALADKAVKVIPERVRHYAPLVDVTYSRITIRNQRSKWGSCSANGNLNFNCLLMLAPPEVLDAIVVHELCHRKEMNHSERFYAEVRRVYPEYDKWNGWLKEHGGELMRRMTQ